MACATVSVAATTIGADRVGDQLAEHDRGVRGADHQGGDGEVALAQRADLACDHAGHLHPGWWRR